MTTSQIDIERLVDEVLSGGGSGQDSGSDSDLIESVIAETRPRYVAGGPGGIPGAKDGAIRRPMIGQSVAAPGMENLPGYSPVPGTSIPLTPAQIAEHEAMARAAQAPQTFGQQVGNVIASAYNRTGQNLGDMLTGRSSLADMAMGFGAGEMRNPADALVEQRAAQAGTLAQVAGGILGIPAMLLDPAQAAPNAAMLATAGAINPITARFGKAIVAGLAPRAAEMLASRLGPEAAAALVERAGPHVGNAIAGMLTDTAAGAAQTMTAAGPQTAPYGLNTDNAGAFLAEGGKGALMGLGFSAPFHVIPAGVRAAGEVRGVNLAQRAAQDAARAVEAGNTAVRDVADAYRTAPRAIDPNMPDSAIVPPDLAGDPMMGQTFRQIDETRSPEATVAAAREAQIRAMEEAQRAAGVIQAQEAAQRQAQAIQEIVASGQADDALGAILSRDAETRPATILTQNAKSGGGSVAVAKPSPLTPVESMTRDALVEEARIRGVLPKGAPKKSDLAPIVQAARDQFERDRIARRAAAQAEAQLKGQRIQEQTAEAQNSTDNPLADILARDRNTTPDTARAETPNATTKETTNGQAQGQEEGLLKPTSDSMRPRGIASRAGDSTTIEQVFNPATGRMEPAATQEPTPTASATDSLTYADIRARAKELGVLEDGPKTRAALAERVKAAESGSRAESPQPGDVSSTNEGAQASEAPSQPRESPQTGSPLQASERASSPNATRRQPWEMTRAELGGKSGVVFHRGRDPRTSTNIVLFADNRYSIESYGKNEYILPTSALIDVPKWAEKYAEKLGFGKDSVRPKKIVTSADAWDNAEFVSNFWNDNENRLLALRDRGIVGFKTDDGAVVFPGQDVPVVNHRKAVETALREGRPVPPEVLKDYPDLAANAKPPTPAEAGTTPAGTEVTREVVDAATGRQNEMFGGIGREPERAITGHDAIDEQIRKQYRPDATDEMFGDMPEKPDDDIPFERKGPRGRGDYSLKEPASATTRTKPTLTPPPAAPRKATIADVPIPTVELVKLSKMLLGRVPKLNPKDRPWWGVFRQRGVDSYVEVTAQTAKDPVQLAKTLAHELGHAMDWLPDKTLSRGNVLARARSESPIFRHIGEMNQAMKAIEAQSLVEGGPTHKALKEELKNLTQWWKPFDEKADPEFTRYRYSARELYADTISVLLNDPAELKRRAPTFYTQFTRYLDRKPAVRDALLELQDMLGGTPENLAKARRADVREAYETAEEVMRARRAEREITKDPVMAIRQAIYDVAAPVIAREKQAKRLGIKLRDEESAILAMESLAMADNPVHIALNRYEREVAKPLRDAGISENDLGEYMQHRRVASGDRSELANPGGYTPETSRQQMASLRANLGDKKWGVLEKSAHVVDDMMFEESRRAADNGLYSREVFENTIEPNRGNYATFAVINYLDDRIGAGVVQMDGTFSDIANPLTTTMMKLTSLIRANEVQEAKTRVFAMIRKVSPEDIHDHAPIPHAPGTPAPTPKLVHKGRELIPYRIDGKLAHVETDPYTAKMFDRAPNEVAQAVRRVIGDPFYKVMHPLYVTFNPGWQVMNLPRDSTRTWKNLNAVVRGADKSRVTVGELLSEYFHAFPHAWKRARGLDDPKITEMLADKSLGIPYSKAVGAEDTAIGRLEDRFNVQSIAALERRRYTVAGMAHSVFGFIEDISNTIEALPKIAGHEILGRRGFSGERRAYVVRNYVGTPNTTRRGRLTPAVNSIWSYANVVLQGYRADATLALGKDPILPTSPSAWWLRSVLTDIAPKAAMRAATLGAFGYAIKSLYDMIPESDLAGFICIPIGKTEDKNGVEKVIYVRIPHMDTLKPVMAASWMLSKGRPGDSFSAARAGLPSWNPMLESAVNWSQYASGMNPREEFRGRDIIGRDAFAAGGLPAFIDMAKWQGDQFGVLTQIQRAAVPGRGETGEKTWIESVLSVPGIGSIIKVSNRGESEKDWAEVDAEDAESARFRLSLPDSVTKVRHELSRLERLGRERLDQRQINRLTRLKVWRSSVYDRITDRMKKSGSDAERDALRRTLEERTADIAK